MLSQFQTDQIEIILVSPRNPLNIGAAARALANFGFHRLSIVAPFAHNWMEAKSAVGAPDLLREARVFETLAEAVAKCHLVLGTGSLDRRKPVQQVLTLPEAAQLIRKSIGTKIEPGTDVKQTHLSKISQVALLFGSEKHGLTSEDLSWCHGIVVIDTADVQPSMNLGQAVAVCLYELSRDPATPGAVQSSALTAVNGAHAIRSGAYQANSEQLDRLAELVEETMAAVNYSTRGMRSANGEALRILLRRLMPNESDLRRMMGLFRRILWQIRRTT